MQVEGSKPSEKKEEKSAAARKVVKKVRLLVVELKIYFS